MPAYEEKKRHSSGLVPFSYYKCLIPDYFASVPLHWHGEFEINFVISGCADFICGDSKFISSAGDIIVIPPNMLHAIYPHGNFRQLYDTVVFSGEMLGAAENDRCAAECVKPLVKGTSKITPRITAEHVYYSELRTAAENIFSCAKGDAPRLDMLMKSELLRFFWLLEESGDVVQTDGSPTGKSEAIRPAIEFMNGNFAEKITVEQLAETVHISKSYFMRLFKETAGVSAIEYLSQIRIKRACEILSETDKTSAETALECGFGNLSNFNRQFKNIVGCAPREYRKINLK
ncbi:MAG: AraC family transcriptional regulator [Ruminococcus sp.]|nr:AraC family transcriptional regulator [Ruminococcus sp.]MCM1478748.1 AraC family transcriptional regulator [Muribaculaceae bacterium]